jgi:hypothetical protein
VPIHFILFSPRLCGVRGVDAASGGPEKRVRRCGAAA